MSNDLPAVFHQFQPVLVLIKEACSLSKSYYHSDDNNGVRRVGCIVKKT